MRRGDSHYSLRGPDATCGRSRVLLLKLEKIAAFLISLRSSPAESIHAIRSFETWFLNKANLVVSNRECALALLQGGSAAAQLLLTSSSPSSSPAASSRSFGSASSVFTFSNSNSLTSPPPGLMALLSRDVRDLHVLTFAACISFLRKLCSHETNPYAADLYVSIVARSGDFLDIERLCEYDFGTVSEDAMAIFEAVNRYAAAGDAVTSSQPAGRSNLIGAPFRYLSMPESRRGQNGPQQISITLAGSSSVEVEDPSVEGSSPSLRAQLQSQDKSSPSSNRSGAALGSRFATAGSSHRKGKIAEYMNIARTSVEEFGKIIDQVPVEVLFHCQHLEQQAESDEDDEDVHDDDDDGADENDNEAESDGNSSKSYKRGESASSGSSSAADGRTGNVSQNRIRRRHDDSNGESSAEGCRDESAEDDGATLERAKNVCFAAPHRPAPEAGNEKEWRSASRRASCPSSDGHHRRRFEGESAAPQRTPIPSSGVSSSNAKAGRSRRLSSPSRINPSVPSPTVGVTPATPEPSRVCTLTGLTDLHTGWRVLETSEEFKGLNAVIAVRSCVVSPAASRRDTSGSAGVNFNRASDSSVGRPARVAVDSTVGAHSPLPRAWFHVRIHCDVPADARMFLACMVHAREVADILLHSERYPTFTQKQVESLQEFSRRGAIFTNVLSSRWERIDRRAAGDLLRVDRGVITVEVSPATYRTERLSCIRALKVRRDVETGVPFYDLAFIGVDDGKEHSHRSLHKQTLSPKLFGLRIIPLDMNSCSVETYSVSSRHGIRLMSIDLLGGSSRPLDSLRIFTHLCEMASAGERMMISNLIAPPEDGHNEAV